MPELQTSLKFLQLPSYRTGLVPMGRRGRGMGVSCMCAGCVMLATGLGGGFKGITHCRNLIFICFIHLGGPGSCQFLLSYYVLNLRGFSLG